MKIPHGSTSGGLTLRVAATTGAAAGFRVCVFGAAGVLGAERTAAATGRDGVRVIDLEAGAHQAVHVIDRCASQVHHAGRIDVEVHTPLVDDGVEVARFGL